MEDILPHDLIELSLSYLPPYMRIMVNSIKKEPSIWELKAMASRGMVRDDRLLRWAIGKGLPDDDILCSNAAFFGIYKRPRNKYGWERAFIAAASGGHVDIMDMLWKHRFDDASYLSYPIIRKIRKICKMGQNGMIEMLLRREGQDALGYEVGLREGYDIKVIASWYGYRRLYAGAAGLAYSC